MAIRLYGLIGEVSEDQLDFLIDQLEEENPDDQDYYINRHMLEVLETNGIDGVLLKMIREAMGEKDGLDIVWVDTEEMDEDEEDDA